MKILHLIFSLDYGGAEAMLVKLLNENDEQDQRILTIINTTPLRENLRHNNKVYSLFDDNYFNVFKALYRLVSLFREFSPDVVQCWMFHSELIGLFIKLFNRKIKLFWNVRNSTSEWLILKRRNRLIFNLLKYGSKRVDKIFVNSKVEINELGKLGYPKEKLTYIPNGFNTEIILTDKLIARNNIIKRFNLHEDAILLVMVARYHPQKDHKNLITAFSMLFLEEPNTHLVLIGNGFDKEFLNNIDQNNLTSCIHFYGVTNNIYEVLPGFDIGVLSSYTEAFPNVIGEYMMASLTVIATDVSDVKEIIGENGFIVPIRDPESLYKELIKVVRMSKVERELIGEKAYRRIVENYPIKGIYEKYISYYKEAVQLN